MQMSRFASGIIVCSHFSIWKIFLFIAFWKQKKTNFSIYTDRDVYIWGWVTIYIRLASTFKTTQKKQFIEIKKRKHLKCFNRDWASEHIESK